MQLLSGGQEGGRRGARWGYQLVSAEGGIPGGVVFRCPAMGTAWRGGAKNLVSGGFWHREPVERPSTAPRAPCPFAP
eukprot:15430552-Alexandrium_andersonii.AAC.1